MNRQTALITWSVYLLEKTHYNQVESEENMGLSRQVFGLTILSTFVEDVMSWINENRNFIRPIILIVFVVTLIGPWMFEQINVPAEYACDKPFIRLEGDFCGSPLSGFQFFSLFIVVGLSLLLLIPFFTTLLVIWKKDSRRLQTINLSMWSLALILALLLFVTQLKDKGFYLWGLWLYIVLAICTLIVEMIIRKAKG